MVNPKKPVISGERYKLWTAGNNYALDYSPLNGKLEDIDKAIASSGRVSLDDGLEFFNNGDGMVMTIQGNRYEVGRYGRPYGEALEEGIRFILCPLEEGEK